ncbi:MAG: hypothetical protein ABIQ31_13325 [Ferruginibacter sp.]
MKQSIKKMLSVILVTTTLFSCTKQHDDLTTANSEVIQGTWKIESFTESSENSTNDFIGFTFNFAGNGKLAALKNGAATEGAWSTTNTRFTIDLGAKGTSNKLGNLTDEWLIVSKTDTKITLKDDNVARNEVLVFSKN